MAEVRSFTWVNEAPIYKVNDEAFKAYALQFIKNLADNWFLKVSKNEKNLEKNIWNARVESSIREADVWGQKGDNLSKYVYLLQGKPIALMIIDIKNGLKIVDLTAHPGSSGAGEIMMEFAANLGAGKVRLYAGGGSGGFYKSLGFEGDLNFEGNGELKLDASKSDKWAKLNDGRWCLQKYANYPSYYMG
jgi:hypothetical protein